MNLYSEIRLREMVRDDSAALSELEKRCPDSGFFKFYMHRENNFFDDTRTLLNDFAGVVAETPDNQMVGAGLVGFGHRVFGGELRPYALLGSLMVHPDYRRRGIARRLTEWRINCADHIYAEQPYVLMANIQKDNRASLTNAQKWSQHFLGPQTSALFAIQKSGFQPSEGMICRKIRPGDMDTINAGLADFYAGYDGFDPTAFERQFVATAHELTNVYDYYVVTDQADHIRAGMGVFKRYKFMTFRFVQVPAWITLVRPLLSFLPHDNILRELEILLPWYAHGHQQAAKVLWQYIRHLPGEDDCVIRANYDPRGPLRDVFKPTVFTPKAQSLLAIKPSGTYVRPDALIAPYLE